MGAQAPELRVTMVGNAGVMLADGATTLLVDLPYESGAFGYQRYDAAAVRPGGEVVAVVTHHHRDHFAPELLRDGWKVLGPPSVTRGMATARVVTWDSVRIGAFDVVVVPTPHTDDHRSYRVRWHGRVFHFTGDTEDTAALRSSPAIDVLFITPWLSCTASRAGLTRLGARRVAYHRAPTGNEEVCGAEPLAQGASFVVAGR